MRSGKYPVHVHNGRLYGVRYDGKPRQVIIDGIPTTVPLSQARVVFGQHLLAFGGPHHELIIDDEWYNIPFGGDSKEIFIAGRFRMVSLPGPEPHIKRLGEVKLPEGVDPPRWEAGRRVDSARSNAPSDYVGAEQRRDEEPHLWSRRFQPYPNPRR